MKNWTNLNQMRITFLPTEKKIIKKPQLNETFLTLLTKVKAVQMNLNHNLQHESKKVALGLT